MISPLSFTPTRFEPLVYPKEIYEVSLAALLSSEYLSVSSFAYKKVAHRIKPVATTLPEDFRIVRRIPSDPLETLPVLPFHPPAFTPGIRYTLERKSAMNVNKDQFLWPEEEKLVHHLIKLQEMAFAWTEEEKGKFSSDYFDPVVIPTIEHVPWSLKNIPIPPGIFSRVVDIIKSKIAAGIYEPSNSSYRSRWFCVLKKDGKSLRLVHDLQPLNAVAIKDAGLPPVVEQYAESFGGRGCYGIFDLMVGFDQRELAAQSRDLTTFQSPLGTLRLTSIPMGPPTRYETSRDSYETIPQNPHIRRFVWEHLQNVNRILQRIKHAGGTFSAAKSHICVPSAVVVGHLCTYEGRLPDTARVQKVLDWPIPKSLTEVRGFLGTVGTIRIFIKDFATIARPLVRLTKKDVEFEFGEEERLSMEKLKVLTKNSPAIRAIDYTSDREVILAVDTSYIAVGYILSQMGLDLKRYPSRFGSLTLSDRESRYSQAKLELFGLFRALKDCRIWVVGVKNLVVEVDAKYIKGMINNPDIQPNATINRWISAILLFDFRLRHVPGHSHGPDGLSRRPPAPEDPTDEDDYEEWIDRANYFYYGSVSTSSQPSSQGDLSVLPQWIELSNTFGIYILNVSSNDSTPTYMYSDNFTSPRNPKGHCTAGPARSSHAQLPSHTITPPPHAPVPGLGLVHKQSPSSQVGAHTVFPHRVPDRKISVLATTTTHNTPTTIPRSERAKARDLELKKIFEFLKDPLKRVGKEAEESEREGEEAEEITDLVRKASGYFVVDGRLWRKDPKMEHKLVVDEEKRLDLLRQAHDEAGHKGIFTTRVHILKRFWWPCLDDDIRWYLKTCHECQTRSMQHIYIPPTVPIPLSLFRKVYIDTMLMPKSNGYRYIVHARCSLSSYPEWRMLRSETGRALGSFIFEDILCRWGAVEEIVTDNGPAFIQAVEYLSRQYHINHIRISPYNSRANGPVERRHRDVRESLVKAAEGQESKWTVVAPSVFWAERVTIQKSTGYSPYYLAHGTEPLFPFDLFEATYLAPILAKPIPTSHLIAYRAIQLQKRPEDLANAKQRLMKARWESIRQFEEAHKNLIKDFNFGDGDLVLVRNSRFDGDIGGKTKPRYFGPMVVVRRTKGGSYVLAEMDGTMSKLRFGARRLIPYHARDRRSVPLTRLIDDDLDNFIDKTHEPEEFPDRWRDLPDLNVALRSRSHGLDTDGDVSTKSTPRM
ncbi:hypothetical protein NP233_g8218 [Leucocoprinus birnbaumii]|uniref:Integrase catalytic domain-containing protein n=1 Tax=Leucocoprinus birnbaumii TaxID=56174 RepID=A0AAD5VMS9_9AGAR|nr:hypothetical protein NP233_g8218 [Leucocoprinus birnbaumii]